ncbi:spore gernimation protein GerPD [Ammoniphilus sp. YIM 78166]|uniref:spore gernimation protein GerPD n=1 Tax=Ammoniphilus sp. YIM 78166 TaxID=1644106 RepID=UPI0010702E75|nr:spore gernimation protein GerPD [Ammoniphilus sp. YIM 78166]
MNMTVTNKKLHVGDLQIGGVGSSSVFIMGDAQVITSSSIFDTPADSFIDDPSIPIVTGGRGGMPPLEAEQVK